MIFHGMTAPDIKSAIFYANIPYYGTIYVPAGANGYEEGFWKTNLINNRGWMIKYTL